MPTKTTPNAENTSANWYKKLGPSYKAAVETPKTEPPKTELPKTEIPKSDLPKSKPFKNEAKKTELPKPIGSSLGKIPKFCDPYGRDLVLCCIVLFLAFGGILALQPLSSIIAEQMHQDSSYFVKKQAVSLVLGIGAMLFFASVRLQLISRFATLGMFVSLFFLVLVFVPGLGQNVTSSHGSFHRWLRLGPVTFQPSEFSKIALVCFMAFTLNKSYLGNRNFYTMLKAAVLVGSTLIALLVEPQYGTTLYILGVIFLLVYAAGFPLLRLLGISLSLLPLAGILAVFWQYRLERLYVWLDPYQYRFEGGYQLVTSFRAFQEGGWLGSPLASGIAHRYLTYGHTDFALALFAEDFGWLGICILLAGFGFLVWRSSFLLRKITDPFAFFLGIGSLSIIMGQCLLNFFVVTGMLPTTGVGLPFLSYGGSSLVAVLCLCGLLINAARHRIEAVPKPNLDLEALLKNDKNKQS